MKKLFIICLMLFSVSAFSQRTLTLDTIQGAETISTATMTNAKVVTATFTNLGGTSDGTTTLYGSIDKTNWVFLNFLTDDLGVASPKASITGADLNQITITTTLVASWKINSDAYPYTKLIHVGTSADTTQVQVKWSK